MSRESSTGRVVSKGAVGRERETNSPTAAEVPQLSLPYGEPYRDNEEIAEYRAIFAELAGLFGGVEQVALANNEKLSYASKISEAANGVNGRHIHWETWFPKLMKNQRAKERFVQWVNEHNGYEAPKPKRVASQAELLAALLQVADEAGGLGEALLEKAAKKIGTDKGAFRR